MGSSECVEVWMLNPDIGHTNGKIKQNHDECRVSHNLVLACK